MLFLDNSLRRWSFWAKTFCASAEARSGKSKQDLTLFAFFLLIECVLGILHTCRRLATATLRNSQMSILEQKNLAFCGLSRNLLWKKSHDGSTALWDKNGSLAWHLHREHLKNKMEVVQGQKGQFERTRRSVSRLVLSNCPF